MSWQRVQAGMAVAGLVVAMGAARPAAAQTTNFWIPAGGGIWSDVSKWTDGSYPNAADVVAAFTNQTGNLSASFTVTQDVAGVRVGAILFTNKASCTLTSTVGALTFETAAGNASISLLSAGKLILSQPLVLKSSLDLTAYSDYSLRLTLNGPISTLNASQTIATYGSNVVTLGADNTGTYSNGWNVSGAGIRMAHNGGLGAASTNNIVHLGSGAVLALDLNSATTYTSGVIRLDPGATVYASVGNFSSSGGGGRQDYVADMEITATGTVNLLYAGGVSQPSTVLQAGTLRCPGDTTLAVTEPESPLNNRNGRVAIGGTIPAGLKSALQGVVLPPGATLTKTSNGTLNLVTAQTNCLGALDVTAGILRLDVTNAISRASSCTVRAGAALALNAAAFTNNLATITQAAGSAERWYNKNARLANAGTDSYTLPSGVHLQLGLSGGTQAPTDLTQPGSHAIHMTGGTIEAAIDGQNNAPQQSYKSAVIGQTITNGVDSNTLSSATNVTIVMDADLLLGASGVTPGLIGLVPYDLTNKQLIITVPIVDGTAGRNVTKIGVDTVVLSGTNTYSGTTTVSNGVLAIGRDNALPATTLLTVAPGAYFDLDNQGVPLARSANTGIVWQGNGYINTNQNQALAGLAGAGVVTNGGPWLKTVTVNPASGATNTFSGILADTGGSLAFVKTGAGGQVLSGANTFGGGTIVSNGVLTIAAGGVLGTSDVTVAGGTLRLETSAALADAATLRLATGGKVDLAAGVNESVGALTLNGAPLYIGTWGASGSGATHVNNALFLGAGQLTVLSGPPAPPSGTLLLIR